MLAMHVNSEVIPSLYKGEHQNSPMFIGEAVLSP